MLVKELVNILKDFDGNLDIRISSNFSYPIISVSEDTISRLGDVGKPNYEQKIVHIKIS